MRTPAAKLSILLLMVISALAIACKREELMPEGALYSCAEFTLWPDSLVVDGREIIVAPAPAESSDSLRLSSDFRLINNLFNRPAGKGADSAVILLPPDPLICPDSALTVATTLLDSLKSARIEGKQYPVVQTRSRSLAAIIDVVNTTGRADLDSRLVAATVEMLDNDFALSRDYATGLFQGIDPDNLLSGSLPQWFSAADCAAAISFRTNIDHLALLRHLSNSPFTPTDRLERLQSVADSIANAIDTNFWLPTQATYSRLLYSTPYPIQLLGVDVSAVASVVTDHLVHPEIASAAVKSTPLLPNRIEQLYPLTAKQPLLSDAVAAQWAAAASAQGNIEAFTAAIAMLTASAATNPSDDPLPLKSAILRGLFGLDTSISSTLQFHPCVPEPWGGTWRLNNLTYRNAVIDIELQGHGTIISTFAIDGEATDSHTLPADIEGHHTLSITLVGAPESNTPPNLSAATSIVAPPEVIWSEKNYVATIHSANGSSALLYLNGAIDELIDKDNYTLNPTATAMTVSFVAIDNGISGFSSKPRIFSADSISIGVTDIARPWSRSLTDKQLARTHVETTRYRNSSLTFEVDLLADGDYYLSFTYLNGEGIVNPYRRYSLRLLTVNDSEPRLLVFPQLSPENWRHDIDWQTLQGQTLPTAVKLKRGRNTLRLRYYSPDIDGFNHDTNTLIPTTLTLYPR
ncbi:MAG: hypothetical protein K2G64_07740 [Muribaculaceae bacterium]|nr:hypothetical protein [Muribaculaceae bacterium]